jgi:tetratricopeptide (TPR) repeat protein
VENKKKTARPFRKTTPHENTLPRELAVLAPVFYRARLGRFEESLDLLLTQNRRTLKRPFGKVRHDAWYNAGCYFARIGQLKSAARAFHRALFYRRGDFDTLNALGNCYSSLKKYELAAKAFRLAANRDANPIALYNLANSYFDLKKFGLAVKIYQDLQLSSNRTIRKSASRNFRLATTKIENNLGNKN